MAGSGGAMVAIPLAGGGELRVSTEAVTLGERRYELGRIQDALQVSPEPETVALRVAGAGMVEFRPARQGDGRVALEAIYRLRPELRPAGFEPMGALPQGFPPVPPMTPPGAAGFTPPAIAYSPYPPATGYPPTPSVPPGYGTPHAPPYGGANPNANGGEVTPYPRRFWELIAAIFQIYLRRLPAWLGLGLLVGALPGIIGVGFQLVLQDLQGPGAFDGLPAGTLGGQTLPSSCRFTYHAPTAAVLARDGALLAGLAVAGALLSALATAALATGAREALLGRPVRVGASARGGLRRWPATLGVTVLTTLLYALALGPALACLELALVNLSGVDLCNASAALPPNAVVGLFLEVAGLALIVPGILVFLLLFVRLGPAPYVAATEPVGVGRALARSWRLTRGSFWRTLGIMLVMQLTALVISAPFGAADTLPAAVILPALAHVVTAPLLAIAWTAVLLDLQVRREGYAALRWEAEKPLVEPPPAS
jgi:hypothetical protein